MIETGWNAVRGLRGKLENVDRRNAAENVWLHTLCVIDSAVGGVMIWRSLTAVSAQSPRSGKMLCFERVLGNSQGLAATEIEDGHFHESCVRLNIRSYTVTIHL
jgi:hypothetical protein